MIEYKIAPSRQMTFALTPNSSLIIGLCRVSVAHYLWCQSLDIVLMWQILALLCVVTVIINLYLLHLVGRIPPQLHFHLIAVPSVARPPSQMVGGLLAWPIMWEEEESAILLVRMARGVQVGSVDRAS